MCLDETWARIGPFGCSWATNPVLSTRASLRNVSSRSGQAMFVNSQALFCTMKSHKK